LEQAVAEQEEERRRVEFIIDPRKCVHIKLPSELHAEMRVFGFKKKLSLQEMISEFCQLIIDGDSYLHRRMDDLAKRKKEKRIKKLTMQDSENIYDYIASVTGNNK
jgi:hypothetical protein